MRPTDRLLHAFLAYLWELPSIGGGTAKGYFVALPQALRVASGQLVVPFGIPRHLVQLADKGKRRIPAVTPLKRDPASMDVVAAVARDNSLPHALRTAVLFQYAAGLRPGNVYRNSHNRRFPENLLRWRDVSVNRDAGGVFLAVVLPLSKTATSTSVDVTHVITQSPNVAVFPCPVEMFRRHARRFDGDVDSAVFGEVTASEVSRALKKHAPPGLHLAPHSIRIGAASDRLAVGADIGEIMKLGEWANPKTALRYSRWTPAAVRRQFHALTTAMTQQPVDAVAPLGRPAQVVKRQPEVLRQLTEPYQLLLSVPSAKRGRRLYFYSLQGERVLGHIGRAQDQHYFVVNSAAEHARLRKLTRAVDKAAEICGQLRLDLAMVREGGSNIRDFEKLRPFIR